MRLETLIILIVALVVFAAGCSKEDANEAGAKMEQAGEAVKSTSNAAMDAAKDAETQRPKLRVTLQLAPGYGIGRDG